MTKYCPNCGEPLNDENEICTNCNYNFNTRENIQTKKAEVIDNIPNKRTDYENHQNTTTTTTDSDSGCLKCCMGIVILSIIIFILKIII